MPGALSAEAAERLNRQLRFEQIYYILYYIPNLLCVILYNFAA